MMNGINRGDKAKVAREKAATEGRAFKAGSEFIHQPYSQYMNQISSQVHRKNNRLSILSFDTNLKSSIYLTVNGFSFILHAMFAA